MEKKESEHKVSFNKRLLFIENWLNLPPSHCERDTAKDKEKSCIQRTIQLVITIIWWEKLKVFGYEATIVCSFNISLKFRWTWWFGLQRFQTNNDYKLAHSCYKSGNLFLHIIERRYDFDDNISIKTHQDARCIVHVRVWQNLQVFNLRR